MYVYIYNSWYIYRFIFKKIFNIWNEIYNIYMYLRVEVFCCKTLITHVYAVFSAYADTSLTALNVTEQLKNVIQCKGAAER